MGRQADGGLAAVPTAATAVAADARRGHAGLFWLAATLAGLAVVAAVGIVVDGRVLLGAPVWLKPLKFALSFGVYAFALAWMLSLLPHRSRAGAVLGWVVVVTTVVEVGIIVGQAARGRRSHFNEDTPLDGLLFSLMGATVALIWLATLALAVVVSRRPAADPVVTWAVRLGLLIGLIGMGLGTLMVAQPGGGAHTVGAPDGGPGVPLFGWSTTDGDLRVGHFVGMHALQLLPLLAAALAALPRRVVDDAARLRLVWVAAGAYLGLVAVLTWQALRGQPLLAPDSTTLAALALLLGSTAGLALAAARRRPTGAARRTGDAW